jgi:manganese/zinc/iron transport system ATP- binding protein
MHGISTFGTEAQAGAQIKASTDCPLAAHGLTVAYQERPVLWEINYQAPAHALTAIVGPNGAGKSTFIKACLGLIPRLSGTVEFWGSPLEENRLRVGYVPQRESVDWDFPVSALDVVLMGRYGQLGWLRRIRKIDRDRALECLRQVGMQDFAARQISQLSGGQQQRIFLARALAQDANLYLMDEPFAGVDAATERAIVQVLKELKANGCTVLCVHHDLTTVPDYFDAVMMLNMRLIAAGSITEAFTPENLRRAYGGRLTLLDEVSEAVHKAARGQ